MVLPKTVRNIYLMVEIKLIHSAFDEREFTEVLG